MIYDTRDTWNQYKRLSKQTSDLCDRMAELMERI